MYEQQNAIEVEEYVYKKVKKTNVRVEIPQEPIYFQEHNQRIIVGVFPQYAAWNNNLIWRLRAVQVNENGLTCVTIDIDHQHLSNVVSRFDETNKTIERHLIDKVVKYLKDFYTKDRVSKEVFLAKYSEKILNLNEIISITS